MQYSIPIRNVNTSGFVSSVMDVPTPSENADVLVQLLSDDWPAGDSRVISTFLEQSFDGGVTWQHWVGITCRVGVLTRWGALPLFGIVPMDVARMIRLRVAPSATVRLGATVTVI